MEDISLVGYVHFQSRAAGENRVACSWNITPYHTL